MAYMRYFDIGIQSFKRILLYTFKISYNKKCKREKVWGNNCLNGLFYYLPFFLLNLRLKETKKEMIHSLNKYSVFLCGHYSSTRNVLAKKTDAILSSGTVKVRGTSGNKQDVYFTKYIRVDKWGNREGLRAYLGPTEKETLKRGLEEGEEGMSYRDFLVSIF